MEIAPDFIHLFFRQFCTDFEDGLSVSSVKTANKIADEIFLN